MKEDLPTQGMYTRNIDLFFLFLFLLKSLSEEIKRAYIARM